MPPVFTKIASELNFPKEEHEILTLWKERKVFEQSLADRAGAPTFVFYEGPPTANGLPHNGHVLTRVIKDLFPRYKTMRGFQVPRKAGWDTHGLPVEVEVEKELRIHGKAAIEAYGIEPFVKKCIDSVFRYTDEWERLTERVGFWVDLPSAYVTYHKSYVESVWWALSELFKKGLLYQGHKVVWWWAQGGTALSAGEVGLGYKQVDDPSVYVAFPLIDEPDTSLLVWTTTPWTLPSNAYAAVSTAFDYVVVRAGDHKLVVAKGLVLGLAKKMKQELTIEREIKGSELVGKKYAPPFDLYTKELAGKAVPYWQIIAADFVTLDAGTGIVHVAPAFGEDDFQAHKKVIAGPWCGPRSGEAGDVPSPDHGETVPLLCAVKPDGTFIPELSKYAGRWVKDCDKEIQAELKERGLLVFAEQYRHDYPFCWRSDQDPLIQYARPAWYIRTTAEKQHAIENNQSIQWLPEHIKDGRMGDFLRNNVDWALSRERYWGTPLNVWINDVTGKIEAPSSVAEIEKKNPRAFAAFHAAKKADPTLSFHLVVHKPWIDNVTWQNPGEEGTYRRVPDVIDCWFDSGCMPFAQWGFPHTGHEDFKKSFPADFISEAIDQTRGWFYTLLMIATLVFDEETQKRLGLVPPRKYPLPFKTCIVLGHVSDKEGKKESKSKGNYTPPEVILDAVRMEFAVWDAQDVGTNFQSRDASLLIAPEDLDGMDLRDGAMVRLYRADDPENSRHCRISGRKGLPRRVVVLNPELRQHLGLSRTAPKDVKPVEVPRLPQDERITIEDFAQPAPGADAFRWFFYASNPPWNATRHSLSNVRAIQKEFLIKLRNVYSFFTIYANIDGYEPTAVRAEPKNELDRWIHSELAITTEQVTADLDAYDIYAATGRLTAFVDALSNWYVRRSRDRFWRAGWDDEKRGAYDTLYEALVTLSKLIAPFTPFFAETIYQNLVVGPSKGAAKASVHLTEYPAANPARIDRALSTKMRAVRDLVSLGLQVRTQAKLKVRQPLRAAHLVVGDAALRDRLASSEAMIREELNVLTLHFVKDSEVRNYVEYSLKPNFRTLGQRGLGKQAQELKKTMAALNAEEAALLQAKLAADGKATFGGVDLLAEDVEVSFTTKEGFAAAGDRVGVVVLETVLDQELRELGLVRELQSHVQAKRKERGLEYTDRITLRVRADDAVKEVIRKHETELKSGLLVTTITYAGDDLAGVEIEIDGHAVTLAIEKV